MTNCNVSALHCSFPPISERLSLLDQYLVSFVFVLNRDVYHIVFSRVLDQLIILYNHFYFTFLLSLLYLLFVDLLFMFYHFFLFYYLFLYLFSFYYFIV